jgi:hypothetical protein
MTDHNQKEDGEEEGHGLIMNLYWTRFDTFHGKEGIRVRHPMKGVAMIDADEAAKKLGRELLDQNPSAILSEDAHEWFFEFKPK